MTEVIGETSDHDANNVAKMTQLKSIFFGRLILRNGYIRFLPLMKNIFLNTHENVSSIYLPKMKVLLKEFPEEYRKNSK